MSVSDPLLKKLKCFIYELRTDPGVIKDDNTYVQTLCETLEEIMRKGLKKQNSFFGMARRDYWSWIEYMGTDGNGSTERVNPIFSMAVTTVKNCDKTLTTQGRGRLFIRLALQKKILSVPIEQIHKSQKTKAAWYEQGSSILGDEILTEIFLSLLFEATEINFKLNCKISSYLDETWIIPRYKSYELVPCRDLGIRLLYVGGRALVVSLDPNGVAKEQNKVEPGDILDEMYGEGLKGITKGKIPSLLRGNKGWPVYLSVIKARYPDGRIFPPVSYLIKQSKTDAVILKAIADKADQQRKSEKENGNKKPAHAILPEDGVEETPVPTPQSNARYKISYIGKMNVGTDGSMKQIEGAIGKMLSAHQDSDYRDVILKLGETGLTVADASTIEIILKHSYTEISSCGRRLDSPKYFAYIAGETTCTLSKEFVSYFFKSECEEEARNILCAVAQGFGRTHWFI